MDCIHREESKVRLVVLVRLVVKNVTIASMTALHTVTLFSLLKYSAVSWLFGTREGPD